MFFLVNNVFTITDIEFSFSVQKYCYTKSLPFACFVFFFCFFFVFNCGWFMLLILIFKLL